MKLVYLKSYLTNFVRIQTKLLLLWRQYATMLRQFVLLSITTLFVRGSHIICMPLMLRLLSPTDYGVLALLNSFIAISSACMGLGLRQSLPLYYFACDNIGKKNLIQQIIVLYLLLAPVIGGAIAILCKYILFADITLPWYLFWCAGSISFGMFFIELLYQLLQYHQRIASLTVLQIIQAVCTIGITYIISVYTFYSLYAPLIAQASAMLLLLIIACYLLTHSIIIIKGTWHTCTWSAAYAYLATSIWFLPSMLFGWMLAASQRWIVARYLGLADVGIYAVADGLCQLSFLVCTYAMVGSHMPHMLEKFSKRPHEIVSIEQENHIVMFSAMITSALLLLVLRWLCMPVLQVIVHERFAAALAYLFPLMIGSIFLMGAHFLSPLLQHKKRTIFLGCSLAVPALCNILLGILLVPRLGLQGAVIAQVIAYVSYFCMNFWYNQRLLNAERKASGCKGS